MGSVNMITGEEYTALEIKKEVLEQVANSQVLVYYLK